MVNNVVVYTYFGYAKLCYNQKIPICGYCMFDVFFVILQNHYK